MKEKIGNWWDKESETFTHLMNEGNESFTHGEVVLMNVGAFLMCTVALLAGLIE